MNINFTDPKNKDKATTEKTTQKIEGLHSLKEVKVSKGVFQDENQNVKHNQEPGSFFQAIFNALPISIALWLIIIWGIKSLIINS